MAKGEEDEEKKRKRKERKDKRKKERKDKVNELNSEQRPKDDKVWKGGKIDKNRRGRKSVTFSDSYPFDQTYKDDCVADALSILFSRLAEHVDDKKFYPRYVAHAVSRTVAQMVQMVCYSNVYFMDNWLCELGGGRAQEWKMEKELELPPIDTWARAVIPIKQSSSPVTFLKPLRSLAGQFKQLLQPEEDCVAEIPRNLVWQRASEANILAHKMSEKFNHCTKISKGEARRRKSNNIDRIDKQRNKIEKTDINSLLLDQAMLNKVLKAKGLLPPPKPHPFEILMKPPKPPYFETYSK